MKKLAIVGASAALAAMPVLGVFADTQSSVTDTIQLTVTETCTMSADTATRTVNLGFKVAGQDYTPVNGASITITCNSVNGWEFKAQTTDLSATGTGATTQTIPFGVTASGSYWSALLTVTGGTNIINGWSDYATTALGSATTVVSSSDSVSGVIIVPTYKAHTSDVQDTGTYEGTVTYTLAPNVVPQP